MNPPVSVLPDHGAVALILHVQRGEHIGRRPARRGHLDRLPDLDLAPVLVGGNGDVIDPEDNLIAIGSGGPFAQSAARALLDNTDLDARTIVEKGLGIAADICIYTNHNRTIEELDF